MIYYLNTKCGKKGWNRMYQMWLFAQPKLARMLHNGIVGSDIDRVSEVCDLLHKFWVFHLTHEDHLGSQLSIKIAVTSIFW